MDQIIDNELNLALNVEEQVRIRTEDLNIGYDEVTDTWELIVRYVGDIEQLGTKYDAVVRLLSAGYALVTIPEKYIREFSYNPQIVYIEKPKKLTYEAECLPSEQLTGQGVIVAVIDSGIDYSHPEFVDETGKSRILAIYDENDRKVYDNAQINQAIYSDNYGVPLDYSGHGTAVAAIAAGGSLGVAPKASIIAVKLARDEYYNTARLMEGIDFVLKYATEQKMPVAINISMGNNYGAHNGSSLLETYIDEVAGAYKSVICVGSGNEGNRNIHVAGNALDAETYGLSIGDYEPSIEMQLWKNYADSWDVELVAPNLESFAIEFARSGMQMFRVTGTSIYVYVGKPAPYLISQEILIQFVADNAYVMRGLWQIRIKPKRIVSGDFDMWLSAGVSVSTDTGFVMSSAATTITIPATASKAISVGAYDSRLMATADFSGRGYTKSPVQVKPEIVAPGVNIRTAAAGGGYRYVTGTSFATPFVTGNAALFMEWGIVKGNDPYMYGEKIKAELIKRAGKLPGFKSYPNPILGWGTLCFSR